jgi:hypothetical protein
MSWQGPGFIIALVLISTMGWVVNNWVRARHGYAPSDDWGRTGEREDRKVALLTSENERLVGQVGRLEERIAVLERIATDPAVRTARDIDALR